MIYLLHLAHLLFLFVKSSSERCLGENTIVFTGETYSSSGTGYRYGIIHTPNFPAPFKTPFNRTYIIDASYRSEDYKSQINVYLTQMYLTRGVRFFQRSSICPEDKTNVQRQCGRKRDQEHPNLEFKTLHEVVRVSTSCPFLEIQVSVPTLYGYHYRTRDPFLYDIYGFNITYEIVPENQGPKNDSCRPSNCSSLGHCYLSNNWKDFYCACAKSHPGKYCQYNPQCDPDNNVTFCKNGGKCSIIGSGDGYCDCSGTGFKGPICEKKSGQPTPSTKPHCSHEASKPCSCRPLPKSRRVIPDDWVKYEASIAIGGNIPIPRAHQDKIANELRDNITRWFRSSKFSDLGNATVAFHRDAHDNPKKLLVHFSGFSNTSNLDSIRQYLFLNESTTQLRQELRLQKSTFEVLAIPRLKYKSLEVSKKPRMKMGTTASLTCTAITGPSKYYADHDIKFRWFKDGLPINTSIAARHMKFSKKYSENETMSVLLIDSVSPYDGGVFTCEINDMEFGDQVCGETDAEIILPPKIEISPMSLTLVKESNLKRDIVITCTDGRDTTYDPHNRSIEFEWRRGVFTSSKDAIQIDHVPYYRGAVVEDIIPQGQILRILSAESSEIFRCVGNNTEGETRSKILDVRVLDSKNSPSCKPQYELLLKQTQKENKLQWVWTAPNSTAMLPCPKGFVGFIKRECQEVAPGKVNWGKTDFSFCLNERLKRINLTLQNAKNGFGDWQQSGTVKLMGQLGKYLDANQILYPGEGEKIIGIMEDIIKYNDFLGKVSESMFNIFWETVIKLLKTPNSCVQEKSVLGASTMVADMAVNWARQRTPSESDKQLYKPYTHQSEVLLVQVLPVRTDNRVRKMYVFPHREGMTIQSVSWLKNKLSVIFPLDSDGFEDSSSPEMKYLIFAAYKNISAIVTPFEDSLPSPTHHNGKTFRTYIDLISPIVQLTAHHPIYFEKGSNTHIRIHFNLTKEHSALLTHYGTVSENNDPPDMIGTYLTCGKLDIANPLKKLDKRKLPWIMNTCSMVVQHTSYVECQCDDFGTFGLLKVSNIEEELQEITDYIPRILIAGFTFCILICTLTAAFLWVYIKCQISSNSLYTLKLLNIFFILMTVVILLVEETEIPSESRLVWSTVVCSLLISTLSVQMTKSLRILLMEATPNVPAFIFPWLKNVSQLIILAAITFSATLPVWTATLYAALIKNIEENSPTESAFHESSLVFPIFGGTILLVVVISFVVFYKAVLKTNKDLNIIKQQNVPEPYASDLDWVLEYRLRTLYRSLVLTVMLLVLTLAVVLYENRRSSVLYQSILGLSTGMMGLVVFFAYVVHSEYPMHVRMCKPDKYLRHDPEINVFQDGKANQRKFYPASNGRVGNGSIAGTTGLLPVQPTSILRNGNRQFGEESESLSVSTLEEQSMDTFSTEMSFMAAAPPLSHQGAVTKIRTNSVRSNGSDNPKLTNGSSGRASRRVSYSSKGGVPQPIRGCCLISSGDYILPSVRNNAPIERPPVQTEHSSTSTTTCDNYLPINDQDEIQNKISHDLRILLPMQD